MTVNAAISIVTDHDWPVFPCNPMDKRPLTEHGFKDASKDHKQIKAWWRKWPNAMIGVPMGSASGVWAVDPDVPDAPGEPDGVAAWEALVEENQRGVPVLTRVHYTPSGGRHYVFKWDPARPVTNSTGDLPKNIDVRGEGGYIVVPPSKTADGKEYRANEVAVKDAPDWLFTLILVVRRETDREHDRTETGPDWDEVRAALNVVPSNDYETWYRVGGALRNGLGRNAFDLFRDWSAKSKKFSLGECQKKWSKIDDIKDLKIGTVFHYADQHDPGWRARWREQADAHRRERAGHWSKFYTGASLNVTTLEGKMVPEQKWAVEGRIPLLQTTLFSGEGAAGKSLLALQLAVCCALNNLDKRRQREWLGVIPRGGPAIFLDAEDGPDVLHYRLDCMLKYYKASYIEAGQHLHILAMSGRDSVMATYNGRRGVVEKTLVYDKLCEMAADIQPVMIVIASSADVFAGDEIRRTQVQQFIMLMTKLATIANGAVTLISHPSLTGIMNKTGISGTTQWHNSVRARMYLKTIKGDDGTDEGVREMAFMKNSYGPVSESMMLKYQNGLFLPIDLTDSETGVSIGASTKREIARNVFVRLLKRFTKENRIVGPKKGTSFAPALFAKEREAIEAGCTSQILESAMRTLIEKGIIFPESYGRASRGSQKLVLSPTLQGGEGDEQGEMPI